VVAIPGDPVPENLALDWDGTLYFGITAGEVWEVTNAQTQETDLTPADLTRVAELPGSVVGVEVVATADDGLVFPSDVLFGVTPRQRSDLFVCNFANDSPEDGAILRAHPFATGEDGGGDDDRSDDGGGDGGDGGGDDDGDDADENETRDD
jgi:hypothetical protein